MASRDEWNIEVKVERGSTFTRAEAESLLDAIVAWAEEHEYGIGGGFAEEDGAFVYRFGLCITREDDLIADHECEELLAVIQSWLRRHGLSAKASYRPFTEEEADPEALEKLIARIDPMIN